MATLTHTSKWSILSLSVLIISALFGCQATTKTNPPQANSPFEGALIPHHLLVEPIIESFYQELSDPSIERIILLSPNHFNYGYYAIRSTTEALNKDPKANIIEVDAIQKLKKETSMAIEPKNFEKEHGITVHLPFIQKHFPQATLIPLILKKETSEKQLDNLIEGLLSLEHKNTLVIASIDFTHYEAETIALKNDQRILEALEEWNQEKRYTLEEIQNLAKSLGSSYEGVSMDSPETFYVLLKLMENTKNEFHFWKRTSSTSFTGILDPKQNTSHLYGKFE